MKTNHIVNVCGLLVAAALSLLGSGCASVVRGSSEKFVVQSVPSGAEVRLSTGQAGVTPYEVEIKRKDAVVVTVAKAGYKEFTTSVISSIDGASLGIGSVANFVTLPIINDVVDYKTGANFSHKPNPLIVTLVPVGSNDNSPPASSAVAAPAQVPPATPAVALTPVSSPATAPTPAPTPGIASAAATPPAASTAAQR